MGGRVEGKIALVTGAASGQGAAHARLLAQEGASVLCLDVHADSGEGVAVGIRGAGGDAQFQPLDVGESAQWSAAVEAALERWGRIDVLVNNAGIIRLEDFVAETIEGWNDVIRVDQFGVFLGMKHVIPVCSINGRGRSSTSRRTWGSPRSPTMPPITQPRAQSCS